MEIDIYNIDGKKTSKKVSLEAEVFGVEPNDHAIYLDVKQYLANQRQGTHKSKERSEIVGSTKKLRKQKGTGAARIGSIKSPLLRGGGRVFGPQPRDYGFKLNKKTKRLARVSALSHKAKDGAITVLDQLAFEKPRTKAFVQVMKNLELDGQKVLVVVGDNSENVYMSGRNYPKAQVRQASDLNSYDILNSKRVVFTESALNQVQDKLKN
jgi:large subunit ribosomal protein L4